MFPWMSLIPWKIVGMVAAVIAIWGYGYWGGVNHERERQITIAAKQLEQALKQAEDRYTISLRVERQLWEANQQIKTVTKTITKVIRDEKPSSNCSLVNGWVQRHNEAATNTLPKAPGSDYAEDSRITADKALETIAENYGTCHEIREIAVNCQDWIREQAKIK